VIHVNIRTALVKAAEVCMVRVVGICCNDRSHLHRQLF